MNSLSPSLLSAKTLFGQLFFSALLLLTSATVWAQAPANDDNCGQAINIAIGNLLTGSNTNATSTNEPILSCNGGQEAYYKGVWYTVVGTGLL